MFITHSLVVLVPYVGAAAGCDLLILKAKIAAFGSSCRCRVRSSISNCCAKYGQNVERLFHQCYPCRIYISFALVVYFSGQQFSVTPVSGVFSEASQALRGITLIGGIERRLG